MRAAVLLAVLIATPAAADDLGEAVSACLGGIDNPQASVEALAAAGWQRLPDDTGGATLAVARGDTSIYFSSDGSLCSAISSSRSTADILAITASLGLSPQGETEMGCPRFVLPDGRVATVNGAEPDPDCVSDTSGAFTLYTPGG